MKVDVEAQPDAVPPQRGHLHDDLDRNAQGVAKCQQQERELGVLANQEGIGKERRRGDEVVEDGGRTAPEVVALGVEDTREDGAQRVEDDLDHEEAEEVDRKVAVERIAGREGLGEHHLVGKDQAQGRDGAHEYTHERHEVRGVGTRPLATVPLLDGEVDRQEGRDEHAADDELVELVG